ncbi:MucBP domain-containing protein, partial [Lactococcus taiwanensis]|uniref:MucBP domain-containing protein n=1 Tax=Lactococcus taiwanensis TaxID=1151742 RepID=UPI0019030C49
IPGYTLDEKKLPTNATGTLTDKAQIVTYVYSKDAVAAEDVTVKYVDESGNSIHDSQTIKGNIGDEYDASTPEYKLTIPGYTLDEKKLPTNATGTLIDESQIVTYVYSKDADTSEETVNDEGSDDGEVGKDVADNNGSNDEGVLINVSNPSDDSISTDDAYTETGKNSLPETGENRFLALFSSILGVLLVGFSIVVYTFKSKKR